MTQLEHLQKVILSIAKDIDSIAERNGIEYYLLGGSAIGAIRHKGFIPWDDDLDIIMTPENYYKFLEIAKKELDPNKYFIQRGLKDWSLDFSKVRLKGTILHEPEDDYATDEMHGIYVDIFRMDYISESKIIAPLQYALYKYYLCYQLSQRSYKSASLKKKAMMALSGPLRIPFFRKPLINWLAKLGNKKTNVLGFLCGRTKFKTAIIQQQIYGKPKYVKFEDTALPVPEHYHEYLTQMFDDYMQLPPVEQRKGLHLLSVDFGKY